MKTKSLINRFLGIIVIGAYVMTIMITPLSAYAEGINEVEQIPDASYRSPIVAFPIIAYFEGIEEGILQGEDNIVIPEDFSSGKVVLKAKVCAQNVATAVPYGNSIPCDNFQETDLEIEGIANNIQINSTVSISADRKSIEIKEGFSNYGKLLVHVVSSADDGFMVNQIASFITTDFLEIKALSTMEKYQSFGTANNNSTVVTSSNTGDISIFYGNSESTLYVNGPNANKITNVTGTFVSSTLNQDGSVTIRYPKLSKEITTKVKVTILMNDGKSIEKSIILNRTAISLMHNGVDDDDTVYAEYDVNKSYLYNNSNHNDEIFDAYLQVILYKDDVVMGYKQIKIDDEELINSLYDDESGSLNFYTPNQIAIYGKESNDLIDGVNKVSVFLTNGAISFDEELPSIELGLGSGITYDWGESK